MSRLENRRKRRAERHAAAALIMPPEGVPLSLEIAGVGVRLTAQITDILITLGFAIAILVFLGISGLTAPSTLVPLGALLFFIIRIPYYILCEIAWNGQTIGKRLMKIKVISHTGGPLTTHSLVMRNIMKEAEVFLPGTLVLTLQQDTSIASAISFLWVVMAFTIPLTNPYRMRLGDMLAGTHVVHLPEPILLSDLAREGSKPAVAGRPEFTFLSHQLDHYGRFELQTLESFLRAQKQGATPQNHRRNKETLSAIVQRIRKKIGYADAIPKAEHQAFLRAFYNAQRAYLEQRQLFGDRRSDKHFSNTDEPE
ncbi:RDD family protein [Octadecabacter sp. CECT 8868]|uniref:RDD family protein n=1 Tax=Octadecabacter algicola TaxID=2909342 RepID=UPI001F2FE2C6|nr:RDD family protein [Octadecabacter algicola]MCF2903857.1 RDD family protein [Octadecabacter algicola]